MVSIKQTAFAIPDIIQAGVNEGTLTITGGIVRDSAGRIVKHLDEVDIPFEKIERGVKQVLNVAKDNKLIVAVGIGVVLAVGAGVGYGISHFKKKKSANIETQDETPVCVTEYNKSMSNYLSAVKEGAVNSEVLNDLLDKLDTLRENSLEGLVHISFSVELLETLTNHIKEFTLNLAELNNFATTQNIIAREHSNQDKLGEIRDYLEVQRLIFSKAA